MEPKCDWMQGAVAKSWKFELSDKDHRIHGKLTWNVSMSLHTKPIIQTTFIRDSSISNNNSSSSYSSSSKYNYNNKNLHNKNATQTFPYITVLYRHLISTERIFRNGTNYATSNERKKTNRKNTHTHTDAHQFLSENFHQIFLILYKNLKAFNETSFNIFKY